jgi:hypothetical protein
MEGVMSKLHVCIYGQECWCGASVETKQLHGRSVVAGIGGKAGWPIHSDALGVLPEQRQEAYEESVRNGVPTQFDSKGCAILTDAQHAKKMRRSVGMFDRRGFTS